MEAVRIFGDVFWHAVAPGEDDDCCRVIGGCEISGVVAIADIYSV